MAERAIGQAAGGPPDPPRPPGRPSANMPNSRRTSIPRRPWHTFANGPQPGGTMNSRSPERRRPSANVPDSRRTMTSGFSAIDYMSAAQYRELIVRRLIHEIMPPLADHVTPERRATIRGFVREYVERRIANPETSMYQYLQRRLQAHAENQARTSQPVLAHWNLPPNLDGAADSGAQGVQATRNVRGLSGSMHSPVGGMIWYVGNGSLNVKEKTSSLMNLLRFLIYHSFADLQRAVIQDFELERYSRLRICVEYLKNYLK